MHTHYSVEASSQCVNTSRQEMSVGGGVGTKHLGEERVHGHVAQCAAKECLEHSVLTYAANEVE